MRVGVWMCGCGCVGVGVGVERRIDGAKMEWCRMYTPFVRVHMCGRVRGVWVWVRINGAEYGMLQDITAPSLTKGKSIASQCWTGVEGRPRGGVSRTYPRDAFVHQGGARGLQNAMTSSEERTSAESRGLPHPSVSPSRFLVAKGGFRLAVASAN